MHTGRFNYLIYLYLSSKIESNDCRYLFQFQEPSFDLYRYNSYSSFFLIYALQEFPFSGGRYFRIPCLELTNADGRFASDLHYESHKILEEKPQIKVFHEPGAQKFQVWSLPFQTQSQTLKSSSATQFLKQHTPSHVQVTSPMLQSQLSTSTTPFPLQLTSPIQTLTWSR